MPLELPEVEVHSSRVRTYQIQFILLTCMSCHFPAQRLVSSIRPLSGIYYSNETVALFQLVYTENPVVQWSISCHQKTFTCPGVSCSLWHRVSVVGRLLLYSLLRLTFSGIKTSIPECETTDSVGITASTFQQVDFIQFTGQFYTYSFK